MQKDTIKKILFISLSNIGDVVLTLPVLDVLRHNFPSAKITAICSPRPGEILSKSPAVDEFIPYNKHAKLKEKIKLFFTLSRARFDLVVDLRNSVFGLFLPARYSVSPFLTLFASKNLHRREKHLGLLKKLMPQLDYNAPACSMPLAKASSEDKVIVICPGARSHIKRWSEDKFSVLIGDLAKEFKMRIVLVGDKQDIPIGEKIVSCCKCEITNLIGKTDFNQLASLMRQAAFVITNDSACLHFASYLDAPTVAIFGPTDENKYGAWSSLSRTVKKDVFCRPCEKAQCQFGTIQCMKIIQPEDVLRQVREILNSEFRIQNSEQTQQRCQYKRILVCRTDRIGDVLLSTPVIMNLRAAFAQSYIAMLACEPLKQVLELNPCLDEVIIYDKDKKHKDFKGTRELAKQLRQKNFDLAIVLHPVNRVHIALFLAGIKKRLGYNRKLGFLLTDKLKHTKQLGEKHELEYNLDLLRYLGMEDLDKKLFMPLSEESEAKIERLIVNEGIYKGERYIVVHPGASCPSKIWPVENFASVAEELAAKHKFKVVIVSGEKDASLGREIKDMMQLRAINLCGRLNLLELASLLKRASLFISNDSGPVHIACAVGTPVISIFGRNQPGLGPKRWGPLGEKNAYLHNPPDDCAVCLAHNCKKGFACLKAITVRDVVALAEKLINLQ